MLEAWKETGGEACVGTGGEAWVGTGGEAWVGTGGGARRGWRPGTGSVFFTLLYNGTFFFDILLVTNSNNLSLQSPHDLHENNK